MKLSFTQQRMLFLQGLYPQSSLYHFPLLLQLEGSVSRQQLVLALQKLTDRHLMLRTIYPDHHSAEVVETRVELHQGGDLKSWTDKPFQLDRELPWRAVLLDQEHLLLVLHHICVDGWSKDILVEELQHFLNGGEELPALTYQYYEFAEWQRSENFEKTLAYWRKTLTGAPELSTIPGEVPRPKERTNHAAELAFSLDKKMLLERARQVRGTPFMVLLASYFALLYRYTEQEDLVIGFPTAGRVRLELEPLVGAFINSLPVRVTLDKEMSLTDVLQLVRKRTLEAVQHEQLPFEQIVDNLKLERDLSRHPLFQAFLNVMNSPPLNEHDKLAVRVSPVYVPRTSSQFDLNLNVRLTDDQCEVKLIYNTELFEANAMHSLASRFQTTVQAMCRDPEAAIAEYSLLGEQDAKLLDSWSVTEELQEDIGSLLLRFEEQVVKTPERPAVRYAKRVLTYRELNERANRLAHYLLAQGLQPRELVGLCSRRNVQMVVSLLAVHKAGGAYLPLNPDAPKQRSEFMMTDGQARFLLGSRALNPPVKEPWKLIDPSEDEDLWSSASSDNPNREYEPDAPAYVLYTSGSTGKPKGVVVEHRHIASYVQAVFQRYDIPDGASYSMVQPLFVDSSQTVLFSPLISGGCLHLISEEMALDSDLLADYHAKHRIDILKIAPSHLAALQRSCLNPETLLPRRLLIIGGEASGWSWLDEFRSTAPCRIFNHYGPTETTVGVLTFPVQADGGTIGHTVPIGRPLPGTKAYILDLRSRQVAPGLSGELYIGGVQVARGYLNRPQLTEDCFVDNPFGSGKMYKTGDRARFLADGSIEFLGRFDHQVKIRGMRVELGEIESALTAHPRVEKSLVLMKSNQLAAYLLTKDPLSFDLSELRAFLENRLPSHMVPHSTVVVEHFPQTPHGKIDLNALPSPSVGSPTGGQFQPPGSLTEELMMQLWRDILPANEFGVEDNFFHLGGHSLMALTLVARIREVFGVSIPLADLFEHPTIRRLVANLKDSQKETSRPVAQPGSDTAPLSIQQEQLWLVERAGQARGAYNEAHCFRLKGQLSWESVVGALRTLMDRQAIFRTVIVDQDSQPSQRVLREYEVPLTELAELEFHDPDRFQAWVREPFDFKTPAFRVGLVCRSEREHILVFVFHHILLDYKTTSIFYSEFGQLYSETLKDEKTQLPPLALTHLDYARWQRKILNGPYLQRRRSYWRERLRDAPATTRLPFRAVASEQPMERTVTHTPDASLKASLRELLRRETVTEFMLLLAVFNVLLHRYTHQEDLVIGVPLAGQTPGLESTIGFYTRMLCFRTTVEPDDSFRTLLTKLRQTTLDAHEFSDFSFQQLVEELNPPRTKEHTPFFQMVFNYLPFEEKSLKLEGLDVQALPKQQKQSPGFDLHFKVRSGGEDLQFEIQYRSDLFSRSRMERMLCHYTRLLQQLIESPDVPISSVALLSNKEINDWEEWNQTRTDYPAERALGALFSERATENETALIWSEGTLSYQELEQKASSLSARLLDKDAKRVGVLAANPHDFLVAVLATVQAGRSYVPLESDLPSPRLKMMIDDAQIGLVLVSGTAPPTKVDTLSISATNESSGKASWPEHGGASEAYVMFTSGSTGRPKAVAVSHRAVSRLVLSTNYIEFHSQDRVAMASNYAFDASTFEIWGALLNGATLVHVSHQTLLNARDLKDFLKEQAVTVMFITTALFHRMARSAPATFQSLRVLAVGGEALQPELTKRVLQSGPPTRLINVYGPTENTTFSTAYQVNSVDEATTSVPIGRPVANSTAYVLDPYGHLAPCDVEGELYLGGHGLANGYLNATSDEQEKFVENLFGEERLYRTGDRVRLQQDGDLQFLGRYDSQIKWRGFRIEPDEVEQAARKCPGVDEARVLLVRDELTLFFTTRESSADDLPIRAHLKSNLPHWMVPSRLHQLEEFPRNANQKIDNLELRSHEQPPTEIPQPISQAGIEVSRMQSLWQQLLEVSAVGPDDNFFDLGGHSLMAIRLFDRIAQEFDWKGPVSTVFESPTPRLLVKALRSPNENSGVLSFHTEGQRPPFFLLHGTSCLPHLTRALGPHHPLYCVVSNWSESFLQDGLTVEEIADLYLTRLKPYLVDGPFYLGGFSLGGMIGVELARKLAAQGNPPAVLFLLDPTALGGKKPPTLRLPPLNQLPQLIKHQVATFQHRVKDRLQRQKDPIRMHNTRVYHQAIRRYDGSDYSGETVLWYTSQSTLDSWRPHLKGRLLAQALPATHVGFHQDEEIVRRWTGTLHDVLNGLDPHS